MQAPASFNLDAVKAQVDEAIRTGFLLAERAGA
jgi:hypothetical protein